MLSAWNFDANSIRPADISEPYIDSLLVTNPPIADYLDIERDSKYFIVAPKGYGKTLLMKAKSYKLRNTLKTNVVFVPKNQLCENLSTYKPRISLEELNQFKDRQTWEEMWQMCFLVLIIKRISPDLLPEEIKSLFGRAEEIDEILHIILANRRKLYKMRNLIPAQLMPTFRDINKPVYLFIDNIDESCIDFIGQYRQFDDKSYLVWINAQLGGMVAAKEMCLKNKHVKIYLSIRTEAFDYLTDSSQTQMRNYCTELRYSKSELKSIFERNILYSDENRLFNQSWANPLSKFLGIDKLVHRFVKNDDGSPHEEDVFDFIYRHTLGRPRELVMMGSYLNAIKPDDRIPEKICDLVNDISGLILTQYKSEVLYEYEITAYDAFCRAVQSNVTPKTEINTINAEVLKSSQYDDICSLLYRIGLLGWVEKKVDKEDLYTQKFNRVAEKIFSSEAKLPNSPVYILHSCVDKDLKKIHNSKFYNPNNIIGAGYPFRLTLNDTPILSRVEDALEESKQVIRSKNFSRAIEIIDTLLVSVRRSSILDKLALANIYISCGHIYREAGTKSKLKESFDKMLQIFNDAANLLKDLIDSESHAQLKTELLNKAKECYANIHAVFPDNLLALNGLLQCAVIEGEYETALTLQGRIEEIESSNFFEINTRSHYLIDGVKLSNVSIFERVKWEIKPQMNILLGRNGYGKSHLLRLIACMLKGDKQIIYRDYFYRGNMYSKIQLNILQEGNRNDLEYAPVSFIEDNSVNINEDTETTERRYHINFREHDVDFKVNKGSFPVLAIPDNRFLDKSADTFEKPMVKKGNNRFGNSLFNTGAFAFINQQSIKNNIEEILFSLAVDCYIEQSKKGGLEANINNVELAVLVQEVFKHLTDTSFKFDEVVPQTRGKSSLKIMVKTEGNSVAIPLQKASQGTLSVISMVGLIYNYLLQLHEFRMRGRRKGKIHQEQAVVFIEEIDAHLHPSWQQRIISLLKWIFPHVQFFVTSHSPLVVAGCKEKEVAVLQKLDDNRFSLQQIKHDFIGWTTSDMYQHAVFDIEDYDDAYLHFVMLEKNEKKLLDLVDELKSKKNKSKEEQKAFQKALDNIAHIEAMRKKRNERQYITRLVMENAKMKTLIEANNLK